MKRDFGRFPQFWISMFFGFDQKTLSCDICRYYYVPSACLNIIRSFTNFCFVINIHFILRPGTLTDNENHLGNETYWFSCSYNHVLLYRFYQNCKNRKFWIFESSPKIGQYHLLNANIIDFNVILTDFHGFLKKNFCWFFTKSIYLWYLQVYNNNPRPYILPFHSFNYKLLRDEHAFCFGVWGNQTTKIRLIIWTFVLVIHVLIITFHRMDLT